MHCSFLLFYSFLGVYGNRQWTGRRRNLNIQMHTPHQMSAATGVRGAESHVQGTTQPIPAQGQGSEATGPRYASWRPPAESQGVSRLRQAQGNRDLHGSGFYSQAPVRDALQCGLLPPTLPLAPRWNQTAEGEEDACREQAPYWLACPSSSVPVTRLAGKPAP